MLADFGFGAVAAGRQPGPCDLGFRAQGLFGLGFSRFKLQGFEGLVSEEGLHEEHLRATSAPGTYPQSTRTSLKSTRQSIGRLLLALSPLDSRNIA